MKKRVFYTELSYILGITMLALGTSLTAWGDFGISMVVVPAYMLHLIMSRAYPWFTFGVAEYFLQAMILVILMCILRKVKFRYFLSFLTAILYGLILDGGSALLALLPQRLLWQRLCVYIVGDLMICAGIAMVFRTYIPPEAYEIFVMELSEKWNVPIHTFKTFYDCGSLVVALVMSCILFRGLEGISIGTFICAFLNGFLISLFSRLIEKIWQFEDRFSFRDKFN